MKHTIHLLVLMATTGITLPTHAQVSFTFRELTKQKKTEIKYLTQQIAELKLYLRAVKKGYNIVQSGLNTVHSIKNGEFNLHDIFYANLLTVNSVIKSVPDAVATVTISRRIHRNTAAFLHHMGADQQLPASQKRFIELTCQKVLSDVDRNMSDLEAVLTSGQLQLDDNQRLQRIVQIHQRSLQQLQFTNRFFTDARLSSINRLSDKIDNQVLGNRYHLQNPQP